MKSVRGVNHFGILCLNLLVMAGTASAGILFSTDGTATPGFNTGPNAYGAYANPGGDAEAAKFVATSSGILSFLEIAADTGGNGTFQENFELRLDNGGVPGTVIDTIAVNLPNSPMLVSGNSTSHPALTAGQAYWLEDTIPPTALVGMRLSSPGVSGVVLGSSTNNGPWESVCPSCGGLLPAFALVSQDAATPEPSTGALSIGVFLLACVFYASRLFKHRSSLSFVTRSSARR